MEESGAPVLLVVRAEGRPRTVYRVELGRRAVVQKGLTFNIDGLSAPAK